MDFKKSKKYTESYKTEFLNKLNEGKMVDVQEGQNLKVAEVSKELPKNAKIEKDEKQSFEDYKTMYKDVITQKCIEDYGVDTDTKLWEDTAKELYLKSKTYIPTGEEKSEEVLVKKEESKSLKENKNPEDLTTIKEIEEYINNIQDKHTKNILHHILEDEKQQENPNVGYLTMAIRKVSEVENSRNKKTESMSDDWYKQMWDKYVPKNGEADTVGGEILRTYSTVSRMFLNNGDKIWRGNMKNNSHVLDPQADTLYDLLPKEGQDLMNKMANSTTDNAYEKRMYVLEDFIYNYLKNNEQLFDSKEKKTEGFNDNTKFLTHILNGVIKDIQDKFNVIATAEFDTNNTNSVVVTLKGNTLDLIDATSYLSKVIRNDNVDFRFDDVIINNTIQCYITPKTEESKLQENNTNLEYNYMLLDRLKQDCEYFLGNGNGSVKHLWAGDIDEQIDKMKELYNSFADDEKPEWITMKDINNYEKKMKALKNSKEKKTEVTERDLSKDLFQDEANRRIYNRLINLDVYLEQLKRAIENNDTDSIIANKSKIKSNVAYLIPALNIKGSVNGLTDYLKTTDFDFENNFKKTADLLKDLNNEDKKEESVVSDYTLSEIKKVIDSDGNDFTIKVVNSNEDVETKTLNIDREDLISIYNVLGGNKDLLQEDQYENERRRGKPSIEKIAETEFYDNQDWYIQHIKDYKDVNDFVQQEIFEIASEYNLKEDTAKQVCKEIYNLAIKN